jgi:hypothetical protein
MPMPKELQPDGKEKAADPLVILEQDAREVEDTFQGVTPEASAAGPGVTPQDGLLDPATVELLVAMPFDYIAARNGPHWKLTPEEKAALVPVATRVANKYSPALLAKWADEAALAAVLLMVLFKRVQVDNELKAKREAEAKAAREPAAAA